MKPILEVRDVWKEYRRGAQQEKYLSLRDNLFNALKPGGKKEKFWALQDINFSMNAGESLAIIGKNGAGKSTLLKILSRITPPTKGEIVMRGRLASLLEVGTGFHPELTGNENIFLNGSLLGLTRSEIKKQFDAIVDFSGVETFLETPLKHYSSGMQLRLAFAVAIHLEPEILVIDEVLAVGDSSFQQKCIAKMTEVSQSGRTLIFVSHNIQAIKNLCTKGIILEQGVMTCADDIDPVLAKYMETHTQSHRNPVFEFTDVPRKKGVRELVFDHVQANGWQLEPAHSLRLEITLRENASKPFRDLLFGVNIRDNSGQCLYHLSNAFIDHLIHEHQIGQKYTFEIPELRLKPGQYSVGFFLRANEEIQDWMPDATVLEVVEGNIYRFNNTSGIAGMVQTPFKFSVSS